MTEVVHEALSFGQMPGDYWRNLPIFACLRLHDMPIREKAFVYGVRIWAVVGWNFI